MKERVSHDAYTKEMENFASDNISSLDTWVFDKVSFYQHYTKTHLLPIGRRIFPIRS